MKLSTSLTPQRKTAQVRTTIPATTMATTTIPMNTHNPHPPRHTKPIDPTQHLKTMDTLPNLLSHYLSNIPRHGLLNGTLLPAITTT